MTNAKFTHPDLALDRPGYRQTSLGCLPKDWEIKIVQDCCEIHNQLRKPISEVDRNKMSGPYPYYGPTKIQDYIDEYRVEGKYALIGEDGDHFLKYSEMPMTQLVQGKFNVNNHAHIIKGTSVCSVDWFFWYFHNRNLGRYITRQGAGRFKLNKATLEKIPLPLPPLAEQKAIAAVLSTWDRAIDAQQRLIQAQEQRKRGLMQRLLSGELRVPGAAPNSLKESPYGKIPVEWDLKKARKVFESISAKNNANEELLAVTQENGVIPRRVLESRVTMPSGSTSSYKLVEPGDFVISLRSFQGGLEYSPYRGIVSPAYTVLKPKISIERDFFRYYFKSPEFIKRLSVAVIGIRDGKQISYKDFGTIFLPVPPIHEQFQIAAILRTADDELDALQRQLTALENQKRGLMQRLLTGEVRVPVGDAPTS